MAVAKRQYVIFARKKSRNSKKHIFWEKVTKKSREFRQIIFFFCKFWKFSGNKVRFLLSSFISRQIQPNKPNSANISFFRLFPQVFLVFSHFHFLENSNDGEISTFPLNSVKWGVFTYLFGRFSNEDKRSLRSCSSYSLSLDEAHLTDNNVGCGDGVV